jgi:hypothetical protein
MQAINKITVMDRLPNQPRDHFKPGHAATFTDGNIESW